MRTLWKRAALIGLVTALIGLVPMTLRAQDANDDSLAAVEAVIERYQQAQQAYYEKYRAAAREERAKLEPPAVGEYLTELVVLAEASPRTGASAKAWMMVVQLAPQGEDPELIGVAVETLVRDHSTSAETAGLGSAISGAGRSIGAEKATQYLRVVIAGTPTGATQGGALLALAQTLSEDSPEAGSAADKELDATLARLQQDYTKVLDSRGRTLASQADGMVFERKHLQVGKTVPEIEAADLQGVTFKLSDYRGKVVLLDFWGNW